MDTNVGIALLLTAGAGLSTTIGSFLGLAVRKPGPRFCGIHLGLFGRGDGLGLLC